MRIFFLLATLVVATGARPGFRFRRSGEDAPIAKRLLSHGEIRRKPPMLLEAMGPIAFGKRTGDDVKLPVNGIGTFGAGNVKSTVAKFTPDGMNSQSANGGSFGIQDRPNLGYMERDTAAGKTSGTSTKMNFAGIGKLEMNDEKETGTGLLDFSKNLFPFLQLPELDSEGGPDFSNSAVDPRLGEYLYPKPQSRVPPQADFYKHSFLPDTTKIVNVPGFKDSSATEPPTLVAANPFDSIKNRPDYPARAHAAKTLTEVEDSDLIAPRDGEGFVPQDKEVDDVEAVDNRAPPSSSENKIQGGGLTTEQQVQQATGRVPLSQLGLNDKEVFALCAKFAPLAAKHCYGTKVEEQFVAKCQGYNQDCQQFQAKAKPLGAIANSFSSGVGLTYYDWGVNGIPYYPVNEEGGVSNGHHGKIDFGSWGGGYSDNLGIRDYWSQTGEWGGNWYEGTYGYKTGWSIPVAQSLGVEGGGGTNINVPLKEGEIGKPISVSNGYHVGPYIGLADKVGIDWYNGGVSWNQGFAVPFVGIGVNSGTSIGFPSIGHVMNKMGLNGVDTLNQMVSSTRNFDAPGLASQSVSSVDLKEGRPSYYFL